MKLSRRTTVIIASAAAVLVAGGIVVSALNRPETPVAIATHTPTPVPTVTQAPYVTPSAATVAALPAAIYNAVIPGLVAFDPSGTPAAATSVDKIAADAPIYGADRATPVARFPALNFLKQPSVIVPVQVDGDWTKILTPSRQALPSKKPTAPAQSAAWIRTSLLTQVQTLDKHILVSVKAQTVSIVANDGKVGQTFSAGVGASGTPTPTGVAGYMEARYLDPAQNQTVYPIGLTSLHSTASDEPFGGEDGGLIGIHYEPVHTGNISHGCVRLDGTSITAINELPLGTSVIIQP